MGMRRLAVIDVEGGQQPLFNEDSTVAAVCNGEIYNFRELRKELQERGHEFRTRSDSEVIVHLYEEYGEGCVHHLQGMFAFAVWDVARQRLLLARDRLGIKPLYISRQADRVVFASELKSMLEASVIDRSPNPLAIQEYLALGYVPAPLSIWKDAEKLPPGSLLVADRDDVSIRHYWQPSMEADETVPDEEWAAMIQEAMCRSVTSQMVSDVPLGAFLSGGVDSSAVVAYMAMNSSRPVKTYSIGFDNETGGGYYNELPFARIVAEEFGTEHHEIVVRPNVSELLPELLWHLDEPVADAAFVTTFLVSRFARQDVTVILSGVGGDELFGGYRRYWSARLADLYQRIPKGIRHNIVAPIARQLPGDRHSMILDYFRLAKGFLESADLAPDERYENYVRVFDAEKLSDLVVRQAGERSIALGTAFDHADSRDALNRLIEVDLRTQLPDDLLSLTDRMSMAASLECRVPLLDDSLVQLASRLPANQKVKGTKLKYAMKEALRGLLPDSIIDRKKRGFGAPIGGWFKNELANYLDSVLNEESIRNRELVNWDVVQAMKRNHLQNREDCTDQLLALLNLELWYQVYVDGMSPFEVTERMTGTWT